MILFPPERFDANEWFIIIASLAAFACIWKLPGRFPRSMALLMFLYPLLLAKLFDTLLVLPAFEAYYINDLKEADWFDLLMYFLYAPLGYLFLYVYDRLQLKAVGTVMMIMLASLLAIFVEWVTLLLGVFHYTGWKIYYSLPVYLFVQSFTIIMFKRAKEVYSRTKR
ncbi:MAG: hypothetical protein K0S39_6170 [Paenibacillus sp.]|jgi:hypothetical protein|nr:hypothetical protein [Paenibacillus sp.]